MHPQTIYDVVLFSLRKQGHASVTPRSDGSFSCAYRGNNGDRCAVGMWIADGVYHPEMEGRSVGSLLASFGNLPHWMRTHADLLRELQKAHDALSGEPYWERSFEVAMRDIATRFNLYYTPVGEEPLDPPTVEAVTREAVTA